MTLKESQYYRGYGNFANCVTAWFVILFILGSVVISGFIWNNNRLWSDENDDIAIAQANNDFWAMVSGQSSFQDNVYGDFAGDLYEFTQQGLPSDGLVEITTDTINTSVTTQGYNPLLVDTLDEFVAPVNLYDGFEEATGINAFSGVDINEDTVRDAGSLKGSFVDNINQVVSGDSTGVLELSTTHTYSYRSWNIWRELTSLYFLVGVIALLLGGVHFKCDSYNCHRPHYTLYGWSKFSHHTGAKIWLAIICPIMFVVWLAFTLLSWPFRAMLAWINKQYDTIDGKTKAKKNNSNLQVSIDQVINDLNLYRDQVVAMGEYPDSDTRLEEIDEIIGRLKEEQIATM